MELPRKLSILADAAKYAASAPQTEKPPPRSRRRGLRLLLTSTASTGARATSRARFAIDEVVRLTLEFYRRNYIEGLFLSSGVARLAGLHDGAARVRGVHRTPAQREATNAPSGWTRS